MIGTGVAYAVSSCSGILDFESVFSVYNVGSCGSTPYSTAQVQFRTEAGAEYFIAVQGIYSPSEGDFELQVSTVAIPANDDCSGALTVVPGEGPIYGWTSIATYSGTNSSCSGLDTSPDLWYRVEGTGRMLTASTCGERTNYDSNFNF